MRLSSLKHLLEVAKAISPYQRVIILGSSALLPLFPELGEEHQILETSFDADLMIEPCDEMIAQILHEAIGEGSLFSSQKGYYIDVLRPSIQETLPQGWQNRLKPLPDYPNVFFPDPYDLCLVKLKTGRKKDLLLIQHLLSSQKIDKTILRSRFDQTPFPEKEILAIAERIEKLRAE
ncbi:MAG: DUF6036 family nucleotidyltransferase [Verrucomicrobiota bacterium]